MSHLTMENKMNIKTGKEQVKYYETKIKKCKRAIKDLENLIKLTKKEMTEVAQ